MILRSLCLSALLACGIAARAEFSATNQLLPGIIYYSETRTNLPTRLFVAEIDLKNPKLHVRVGPGGADPDGAGKWQTTLMLPTEIAQREKFDLVVNGDFFEANNVKDAEGKASGYRAGQFALVVGSAMTDGKVWSVSAAPRPCLIVHTNRAVTIETIQQPPADDWEVISGNTLLLKDGVDVAPAAKVRHPRTVVGLDATGTKLTILVVDGRKPGIAVGMSYHELAQEMLQLGCRQALNLDGGGSSVMAIRVPGADTMKILNVPTDGRERAVANTLGISIDR
ncbi:MAG TPA: phosphodiester glycosidase family protein [Verrucomicrobiae bacterium]